MELIADVGGTNTRCALVDERGQPTRISIYENSGHASLLDVLRAYLDEQQAQPRQAALAIAAPVTGDSVRMTNRQWHFSVAEMRQDLGLDTLALINDFAAIALSLPRLEADDVVALGGGRAVDGKAMAVLGPGTGLGVSGLIPGPQGWAPLAGEGGHATLAPGTARETALADAVTRRYGHCSAERLISGPGIALTYDLLREFGGAAAAKLEPRLVVARAEEGDPLAQEALALFFALLGSVAGNLALLLGAVGGVYIGGGIAPKLLERLQDSTFRERFEAKGRYAGYMQSIPTSVIVHPTPALLGLASLV